MPSFPLALFVVMLPKVHLTLHSRMSSTKWVITPTWLSGSWKSFLFFCVLLPPVLNIFCFCYFFPCFCPSLHEIFYCKPWLFILLFFFSSFSVKPSSFHLLLTSACLLISLYKTIDLFEVQIDFYLWSLHW